MASGYNSPVSSFIASALRRASMPTLASNATNITGVSSPLAAAGQQQQQVLQGNAVFDELVCSSAAVPDISWPNVAVSVLQLNALDNKRPLSAIEDNKDELLKNQLLSDPLALLDFVKFSSTPFATVSDSQLNQAQVQKNKRRRTSDIQPKPQQETKEAQQEPLREGLVDSKKSNSKPTKYQCSRCHKYFTRPSSLTTHVYTHTGEKPHECPVAGCTKRFSVLSNMRRHMKLHQDPVVPRSRRPSQYDQYYMSYPYPIIHHGQPLPHQYQQYQQYQYPPYMVPAIDGNCLPLMQHMTPGIFAPQLASGMQDSFPLSVPGMAVSLSPVCAASVAAAAAANMNRRFSTPAFSTLYPDMTPSATPGSVSESGNSAVLAGDMPYMPVNGVSVDSAAFAGQTAQPPTQ
ncbi:hypothetical protein LPJ64_003333 [Coemansia asiatica]|uniref:C2H2-type domain-containing protein n=1 Tax=Coemansia asiatica TaxID=1052880 RepID=A0A9W7XL76_9FUNG|nr:hypothetical protein LPJ64_003333 [Coemansia asiatica]